MKIPTFQVVFRTFKQKISVIFVDYNSLRKQCVRLYKRLFSVAKRLLGNAPSPFDLHFSMQATHPCGTLFLMEFMIQWYIRWAQTHLKEKVPTMILSAPTVTNLLLFDVRYVIDICVQNIGCGFLLPRCKTAQLPVQLIICHIRCWGCGVPDQHICGNIQCFNDPDESVQTWRLHPTLQITHIVYRQICFLGQFIHCPAFFPALFSDSLA